MPAGWGFLSGVTVPGLYAEVVITEDCISNASDGSRGLMLLDTFATDDGQEMEYRVIRLLTRASIDTTIFDSEHPWFAR